MKAFSEFKRIIHSPVWVKERTSNLNYLCSKCHSTCSTRSSIVSALLRLMAQPLQCNRCPHSHWLHFHSHSEWVQKQVPRVTVDDDMKKKWDEAESEKAKNEALVAASKRALDDFSSTIDKDMDEIERLAEQYAGLSILGCFSGPLEKAIKLLELHCKSMEEQDVSRDQLKKMRGSVETMQRRLDFFNEVRRTKGSAASPGT